jgi:beta-lactamase superfamily II metal-dependent hydrolase
MFRIELLPAGHGDAIWIEYGDPKSPRRIVVDGGPARSYERGLFARTQKLAEDRRIDLFVVTHIDADHIDGAIILLRQAEEIGLRIEEIWFNSWKQLAEGEGAAFAPLQGEFLGAQLEEKPFRKAWNARANGRAIVVPDDGPLPAWDLPDDARLTLLSPGAAQLKRLRARWSSAIRDFSPGDSDEALRRLKARRDYRPPELPPVFGTRTHGSDRSVANGSSIAFLLEHDGASCLFAGDAFPRVLSASLLRLAEERNPGRGGRIAVDVVKLPHHGSMGNVNEQLLAAVDCRRWLVSTNGSKFGHPDRDTAELIATHAPQSEFVCNYKSDTTLAFADGASKPRWRTRYPDDSAYPVPAGGIVLDLPTASGKSKKKRRRKTAVSKASSKRSRKA